MFRYKFTGLLIALLILANQAFATAQMPDRIIFNGKEYNLHTNPMEEYFQKFPEKRPKSGIISSGLWRGYVATFEITDNALYLKDIVKMEPIKGSKSFETEWKSVYKDLVPAGGKFKIDWFSGLLVLPFGERVNYVHMGYGSTYENYFLLEIDKGDFKKSREFTLEQFEKFKERQFEAYKKTEEYKKSYDELKKRDGWTEESANQFLKNFVIGYTSKILVD